MIYLEYISEFFLILGNLIESKANLGFEDFNGEAKMMDIYENEIDKKKLSIIITNNIVNKGSKLFKYYSEEIKCHLSISQKSEIEGFEVLSKNIKFSAQLNREKNEQIN